jgi:hypothetical protein
LGPSCGKKEKKKYREKELSQPVIPSLNIIDIHEYSSIPLMDLCHRYELRLIAVPLLAKPDLVINIKGTGRRSKWEQGRWQGYNSLLERDRRINRMPAAILTSC